MADTVLEEEKQEGVVEGSAGCEESKKELIRPVCPACNQSMIRFALMLEKNLGATYGWLCGCIPPYATVELPQEESNEINGNK